MCVASSEQSSAVAQTRLTRRLHDPQQIVPPAPPDVVVERVHLLDRLDDAAGRKLVLVVAPPGYGKTVLLARWAAATQRRRVAWLTLRPNDDARSLASALCAAVAAVGGTAPDSVLGDVGSGGRAIGDRFIQALLAEASSLPPTVLVLDDFHALESPALVSELASIIELAPPELHFVVSSRMDPALPYHRLRLRDEYAELRQDDLRFAVDDAAELLVRVAGRTVTAPQVRALVDRTEGWVAGLHVAAVSLRSASDADDFIERFAGNDRHVTEYLTAHVLGQQPADVQDFLLETSVLDRMSAASCDAVTGRSNGHGMLDHLSRQSVFVSKVDSRGEWFRTHPLFRDLLRSHLRASDADAERRLLRRAAAWSFEHDDLEAGGDYLHEAGDERELVAAIRQHGRALYARGRIEVLVRWLAALGPEVRSAWDVALLEAACHMLAGDTAVAEAAMEGLDRRAGGDAAQMVADLIRTWAVHDQPRPSRVIEAAERVLASVDLVPATDVSAILGLTKPDAVRRVALLNAAAAATYDDTERRARAYLDATAGVVRPGAALEVDEHGIRGLLDAWSGSLRSAEGHGNRAIAVAREAGLDDHPSTAVARLALACVARRRDDADAARTHLSVARSVLERTTPSILLAVHAAELALATDGPGLAAAGLVAHRTASAPTLPPRVAGLLAAAEARVLSAAGDLDGAKRAAEVPAASGPELRDSRIFLAVHGEQPEVARTLLTATPAGASDQERVRAVLWECILDDLAGADRGALHVRLRQVVAHAADEGDLRLLLDPGHHATRLLRAHHDAEPSAFLRRAIDASGASLVLLRAPAPDLVRQLTDRERAVLQLLPTRLTNIEMADRLGVSLNTLKSHLKHVYQKLSVGGRSEAICAAEKARLL